MADKTYTATGEIDVDNRLIKLNLFLPREDPANRYEFIYNFNLSKITVFDVEYNVIFCHLRLERDGGDVLSSQIQEHQLILDIDKLMKIGLKGNVDFNFELDETLFLMLHDVSRSEVAIDAEYLFTNIENIFKKVKALGNHALVLPNVNLFQRPRVLGMSIIIK